MKFALIAAIACLSIAMSAEAKERSVNGMTIDAPEFLVVNVPDDVMKWAKADPETRVLRALQISGKPYIFEAPYGHKGVNLNSDEIANIVAGQMREHAAKWVADYNKDPNNFDLIKFGGVGYIGPKEGTHQESQGEDKGPLGDSRGRWHRMGGTGKAYILVPSRK